WVTAAFTAAKTTTMVIRDWGFGISDGQVNGEQGLVRSVSRITTDSSLIITNPQSPIPNHYDVILMATAVMSSFGGVSPLNAQTAEKIASTISRADLACVASTTRSRRSVPNSRPRPSSASVTPSEQKTYTSPAERSSDSSS